MEVILSVRIVRYVTYVTYITYHATVTDDRRKAIRALSKTVFGQGYRLELMLAILGDDDQDGRIVSLGELAQQLGLSPSSIQTPFHNLVDAYLLSPLPSGESKRKFYQANKSAAWVWAKELEAHVIANEVASL